MKKLTLLVGIGLGFIAGSKAGRGPYERLEGTIRQVSGRADATETVEPESGPMEDEDLADLVGNASRAATDKVTDMADKVDSKVASASKRSVE
jgi:hypothetical protein